MFKLTWWYSIRTFGGCWRLLRKRGVCGTHQLWSSAVKPSQEAAKPRTMTSVKRMGIRTIEKIEDTRKGPQAKTKNFNKNSEKDWQKAGPENRPWFKVFSSQGRFHSHQWQGTGTRWATINSISITKALAGSSAKRQPNELDLSQPRAWWSWKLRGVSYKISLF